MTNTTTDTHARLRRLRCLLFGHELIERRAAFPRPGGTPAPQKFKQCDRCNHIPDEKVRRVIER